MRGLSGFLACVLLGCGASQGGATTVEAPGGDPEQAVAEVTALVTEHCEAGVHGELGHVAPDIMIVGTAGEIMEGRGLLEETNAAYGSGGIEVRHDCADVQRWVNASSDGRVVWVEESIRTDAQFPELQVSFPSHRAMIFENTAEGWRMRRYSLAVRLPDDYLDEVYGQAQDGAPAPAAAAAEPEAAAPAAPAASE